MKTLLLSLSLLLAGSSSAFATEIVNIAVETCETCINKCDGVDDASSCMQACVEEGPCRDHPKHEAAVESK